MVSAHFANGAGWAIGLGYFLSCLLHDILLQIFQTFQADTQRALHSSGAEAVARRKMAGDGDSVWARPTIFFVLHRSENLTSSIHPGSASLSKKARCLLLGPRLKPCLSQEKNGISGPILWFGIIFLL